MSRFLTQTAIPVLITASCLGLITVACRGPKADKDSREPSAPTSRPVQVSPTAVPADTLLIDHAAAVFYTADSVHMEELRKIYTPSQLDGTDHECFYQMKNARTSLQEHWPAIRIHRVLDDRVIVFLSKSGEKSVIDLRNKKEMCGLLIFHPDKQHPVPADMMNIGTSLESYFLR